jgi:hypothetical protein
LQKIFRQFDDGSEPAGGVGSRPKSLRLAQVKAHVSAHAGKGDFHQTSIDTAKMALKKGNVDHLDDSLSY